MKTILMSIRPLHVMNILNGLKTIEIRKKFPKYYVGWVYIYCTKNGKDINGIPCDLVDYRGCAIYNKFRVMLKGATVTTDDKQPRLNGKVVARFWCDKVEEIRISPMFVGGCPHYYLASCKTTKEFYEKSCLDYDTLYDYLKYNKGKAIHITNLEIFDKPKELSEFEIRTLTKPRNINPCVLANGYFVRVLTRAPQSWCYVEL